MSKFLLGVLAAAAIFLSVIAPVASQRGNTAGVENLADGPGKDAVAQTCTVCHGVANITNSWGYTEQGWKDLISSMVKLPDERMNTIAAYLGTHFPEKPRPKSVVIPGPVQVNFREWVAPTLGSRPHDPLAAHDGTIWWAGMWGNVLGHVDPKTNEIKEYPIKTPKSGPHGIIEGPDGMIWFTANTGGYIGKFNPKTQEFTEYHMPDPAARDPHTPKFTRDGQILFSMENSNMVGRLDPKTGDIKLVTMPKPRSQPYGMVMASDGTFYFDEFGANRIGHIDPKTMAINEYNLPNPDSRPRRISITSDDMVWYGDYSRGYLGRLNPKTGEVKEWPSPSGPQSQPYGIVTVNDIIWYNESAIWPNTIVRFDPKTEKFQSWLIPGGGGVVRNMSVMPNGNIAMAESGVNRVALVEIGGSRNGTK
jgi:virginiamycin B lyase